MWHYLNEAWNTPNWQSYPRVYKNKKQDNGSEYFVPEFTEDGKNYTDTFFNDNFDVLSFFLLSDTRTVNAGQATVDISIVFSCHLNALYSVQHRADEEMLLDVVKTIQGNSYGFEVVGIETGIDNVYREFNTTNLKWTDIGKRHILRVNLRTNYSLYC